MGTRLQSLPGWGAGWEHRDISAPGLVQTIQPSNQIFNSRGNAPGFLFLAVWVK